MNNYLVGSIISLVSISAAGCATAPLHLAADGAGSRARAQLDLSVAAEAGGAQFPAAIEPALPSVDRIAHQVRGALGEVARATLDLCVAPVGAVTKVALVHGSSFDRYDAALLRDAQGWRFGATPGPATVQSCGRVTVSYRLHQ